jgi:hypothetical protein
MFAPSSTTFATGTTSSGSRVYMVGGLNSPGFDHLGNDAANVKPVAGAARDRRRVEKHRQVRSPPQIPEGDLVLAMDRFLSSIPASTAASRPFCTSTGPIQAAAITTGLAAGYLPGGIWPRHAQRSLYDNYEMHLW